MMIQGDARHIPLRDGTVQCVVTSPPYWGLRDYHVSGQLGLEPTPEQYVVDLVEVFREVRRVLRDDGTVWLNLGDSYVAGGRGGGGSFADERPGWDGVPSEFGKKRGIPGLKPKDLVGIPWRISFALQADGWYLRSDIIWAKPNPMPESVRDRPTKAHEYVFLLTKSERYYYDAEAVKEPAATAGQSIKMADGWDTGPGGHGNFHRHGRERGRKNTSTQPPTRNRRTVWKADADVWELVTQPYKGAHFATFPERLVKPCVLAGTSERGACRFCGAPWKRIKRFERAGFGWTPTCQCRGQRASTTSCVVLDPFAGSGTVGVVCDRLGRRFVGIELSPEYIKLAEDRLAGRRTSGVQDKQGATGKRTYAGFNERWAAQHAPETP